MCWGLRTCLLGLASASLGPAAPHRHPTCSGIPLNNKSPYFVLIVSLLRGDVTVLLFLLLRRPPPPPPPADDLISISQRGHQGRERKRVILIIPYSC